MTTRKSIWRFWSAYSKAKIEELDELLGYKKKGRTLASARKNLRKAEKELDVALYGKKDD